MRPAVCLLLPLLVSCSEYKLATGDDNEGGEDTALAGAPDIAGDLDLRTSGIALVFVAFSIAFAATTAVYGRLGDIHGERRPLLAGVAIMAVGSVISASRFNHSSGASAESA